MSEIDSKAIIESAGIPVVKTVAAVRADDAVREAARLGYPVALKIQAPEIVHKSDAGGVLLDLRDDAGVRTAFASLKKVAEHAGRHVRWSHGAADGPTGTQGGARRAP